MAGKTRKSYWHTYNKLRKENPAAFHRIVGNKKWQKLSLEEEKWRKKRVRCPNCGELHLLPSDYKRELEHHLRRAKL